MRYVHFGEGDYDVTERAIRELLAEAGHDASGPSGRRARRDRRRAWRTPESYLGSERAQRFLNGAIEPGTHDYRLAGPGGRRRAPSHLAYEGPWRIDASHATAAGPAPGCTCASRRGGCSSSWGRGR